MSGIIAGAVCPCRGLDCAPSPLFSELSGEGGHHLEQIPHDAVVGNIKDRRVAVCVDGHDAVGVLHSHDVLNGPGDPAGDVKPGRDGLA